MLEWPDPTSDVSIAASIIGDWLRAHLEDNGVKFGEVAVTVPDDRLECLVRNQSRWSQATFGSDDDRGPIGPLRHLEKEAREAANAASSSREDTLTELADCFLLILDATRRAGFSFDELLDAAIAKQKINEGRKWPKPESDSVVEHVK